MRLLVIEDEIPMRTALVTTLGAHGYRVSAAADGETGLSMALEEAPDLVLLDVMMPKLDGFALCEELRRRGRSMPVLMLTAKARIDDRVSGLDAGADDYLVKPFSMRELLARVRALLRRHSPDSAPPERLIFGECEIDFVRLSCLRNGAPVELSAREYGILRLLAANIGVPVTRETILDTVWEYNAWPTTRTVDNHIASLRAKLEPEPAVPRYLETVRGAGYRLRLTSEGV